MAKERAKSTGKKKEVAYPGFWGNAKAQYMKEHQPKKYEFFRENKMLDSYLDNIQKAYASRATNLIERLSKKHIDDDLEHRDCVEWMAENFRIERKVRKFLMRKLKK